jgi:hypothetical protein
MSLVVVTGVGKAMIEKSCWMTEGEAVLDHGFMCVDAVYSLFIPAQLHHSINQFNFSVLEPPQLPAPSYRSSRPTQVVGVC